jgi:cyclopropane fatty-acyl-phospholipid synthase-like methyltransferase
MKKKILDLTDAKAFLDLGCGSGAYSIAACQAYPQLKACCVDFEEILEVTQEFIDAAELSERIVTRALSYLDDPLPEGYDVIWFGGTLNGYSARQIKNIFRKVYDVLPASGQLVLYEYFIHNDRAGPLFSTMMNISSFLNSDEAHILTLGEMEDLLADLGFRNVRQQPLVNEMTWLFWAEK